MEKKLYEARCPDYPPDHNAGRADPEFNPAVMQWLPEVFNDAMPDSVKIAYLKEYCLTLRANIYETARDIDKVVAAIEKLNNSPKT